MSITIYEPPPPSRNPDWFTPGIRMLHGDCMEYMATLPDKAFDLAIVDPPYGIWKDSVSGFMKKRGGFGRSNWDIPPDRAYFDELRRVSENQIIWGGNYFLNHLVPTKEPIIWDKENGTNFFGDGEFAWSSFTGTLRIFRHQWCGAFKDSERGEKAFHPTQKPVALYKWLLTRYAKPGQRILDTHGGSGSHCIAAHDLGFDLTWIEKDADYYAGAVERYQKHAAQLHLFEPAKLTDERAQQKLFDEA